MRKTTVFVFLLLTAVMTSEACSMLYYLDEATGKIYVVNNEDYWYDVKAEIWIEPAQSGQLARLWYGWDQFAQGGVNAADLFFDVAVTPDQPQIPGYEHPDYNLGDDLLAQCQTVHEALDYLEKNKIALYQSHMLLGDQKGNAVIVEWVNGERILHWRKENHLIMTNFLVADPDAGNYPCPRFESINERVQELEASGEPVNLLSIGNTVGQAVQPPRASELGKIGGTVYSSFINLTDMQFVLSYKLSNENIVKLDLTETFQTKKRERIKLYKMD